MKTTIEAIFEDGVFKPVMPLELPEGLRVQITVESVPGFAPEDILRMAADVYRGLSSVDIDEMAFRQMFFNRET